jgi:TPR repeat protein
MYCENCGTAINPIDRICLDCGHSPQASQPAGQREQYELALDYLNRSGEKSFENDEEAVKWLKKSAGQGYAEAQYRLGEMYAEGRRYDDREAKAW